MYQRAQNSPPVSSTERAPPDVVLPSASNLLGFLHAIKQRNVKRLRILHLHIVELLSRWYLLLKELNFDCYSNPWGWHAQNAVRATHLTPPNSILMLVVIFDPPDREMS